MRRVRSLETQRLYTLFSIPTGLFVWLFVEIGRRQTIGERHEDEERKLVHGELATLRSEISAARERAAGAAEAEKARREKSETTWRPREHVVLIVGCVVGVLVLAITGIAYLPHAF